MCAEAAAALVRIESERARIVGSGDASAEVASSVGWNAHLESALVHIRGLIGMLVLDYARDNDIHRFDYLNPGPPPGPKESVDRLLVAKDEMDKYMAHITWSRVSLVSAADWSVGVLVRDTLQVAGHWCEALMQADSELGARLRPHIYLAEQAMGRTRPPAPDAES
jgi:hypothetical protein